MLPLLMARLTNAFDGCFDLAARCFEDLGRSAHGRVQGGSDDLLGGDVVDEKQYPGAQGFGGRHGLGEAAFGSRQLLDFGAIDGLQ